MAAVELWTGSALDVEAPRRDVVRDAANVCCRPYPEATNAPPEARFLPPIGHRCERSSSDRDVFDGRAA